MLQSTNLIDPKKLPLDPTAGPSSHSTGESGPPKFADGTVVGTELGQVDDEEADLIALGLSAADVDKRKAKAKTAKRSRADALKEEVRKLESDWSTIVDSVRSFPETPKLQDFTRLERSLKTKRRELQEGHEYDLAQQMGKILGDLDTLRSSLKPAHSFITGTLQTRRKVGNDFYEKVLQLKQQMPVVFQKCSAALRNACHDIHVTKLLSQKDWVAIGEVLTNTQLDSDLDHRDICERLIGIFMKQMEVADDSKSKETGTKLAEALLCILRFATDEVKKEVSAIAAVVGRTPMEGQHTLEEPLAAWFKTGQGQANFGLGNINQSIKSNWLVFQTYTAAD